MIKKTLNILLALALLAGLAACGGTPESLPASSSVQPPAASSSSAPPPASSVPEVSTWLDQAFLTGGEKGPDYPNDKRITAVMVNNHFTARPAYGLSEAKVLVEIKVEAPITRFMALYEDYETLPTVGSLRSARDQFLQLLIPFWGFYVHEGPDQNQPVNWMLSDYEYEEFDLQPKDNRGLYWNEPARNQAHYSWHNIDGETVSETIEMKGSSDYRSYPSPIFNFVPYNQEPRVPTAGKTNNITVPHTQSYLTYFDYNASTARYEMSMFNSGNGKIEPTVDGNNNERLAFDNVLVLFAPMQQYSGSTLIEVDYAHGGGGFLFTRGGWEPVIWRKGAPNERLWLEYKNYTDESNRYPQLNVGTTYLAMVDDDEGPGFDEALRSGGMDDITGEVNTNHGDTED